ncbi:ABC transporter permease [Allorhizocola rhizosphaerae]|uniref:ABC transporter permease n=1 Tax=Allorhizocola rhizosphaerae TaxID=1872709 RepID=UPI000E3E0579|nr:ABC transporter permease [Allorhizocola rhizosphaerae]
MKFLRDTWLVYSRQMLLQIRNPVWVAVGIIQPLFYLLLFAPLLKPALGAQDDATTYRIFVPGMLVMLAMFMGFSGFGLIAELRAGIIERSRVTPVSRVALMLGRCFRDVTTLMFQAVIVTLLAIPFGLRVKLVDVLLAYLLVALMAMFMSSIGYALGLKLRSEDALAPLLNMLVVPVMLLAGILLPLTYAPAWLKRVADFNPFSWGVEGARALFAGDAGNPYVWKALLILGPLTLLAVVVSSRAFAKSVR